MNQPVGQRSNTGNGEVIDEISYKPMENFYGLDGFQFSFRETEKASSLLVFSSDLFQIHPTLLS